VAVTLVDWADLHRWNMIDKTLELGLGTPAETYSSSPHLYTDLDIPEGTSETVGPPRKVLGGGAPARSPRPNRQGRSRRR